MIARIRAGSLTTDSLSAIRLWPPTSASVAASVTVQPWNSRSPVSSSTNTAGQWSVSVSGSIAMNFSPMISLLGWRLRLIAPFYRLSPGIRRWSRPGVIPIRAVKVDIPAVLSRKTCHGDEVTWAGDLW